MNSRTILLISGVLVLSLSVTWILSDRFSDDQLEALEPATTAGSMFQPSPQEGSAQNSDAEETKVEKPSYAKQVEALQDELKGIQSESLIQEARNLLDQKKIAPKSEAKRAGVEKPLSERHRQLTERRDALQEKMKELKGFLQ